MSSKSLDRRLARLEAAGTGRDLGWSDLVFWVHEPKERCTLDNPDYADFLRRPLRPDLARLMADELARLEARRAKSEILE
jgi:hypothetical protein